MKKLERSIGLVSVVAISLSAMLGSGIFVLPGLAFTKTGPSVWLAYVFAGLCVLPAALCKAELGTAMPASGGTYVYLFRALGPLAGTVSGLGLWVSLLLKSSFALVGFGAYLTVLAPGVSVVPTALGLLVAVTALNIAGIGKLSKVQIVIASASVLGLGALTMVGLDDYDPGRLEPFLSGGSTGFVGTAAFVFVSYAGVTKIAALAEEVKDPGKNLPRGILASLFIATVLYGLVTFALVTMVPAAKLSGSLRPIHAFGAFVGGEGVGKLASALAVVTMTSMAAAGLLASSRFPFAMSRDQLLPAVLRRVSERFKTPIVAILMTALLMGVAILTLDVMRIAKLASAFQILIFVAENAVVMVLRESRVAWYRPVYKAPLYPFVQIAGIVSGLGLVAALGLMPIVGSLALAVLGALLYFGYSRRRTAHQGVVEKIGRRDDLLRPSERSAPEEEAVSSKAKVVVALFGKERSPEMLVELAAALSEDDRIYATHLSEIDDAHLGDDLAGSLAIQSLERRLGAMSDESKVSVEFHAAKTRDLVRTVHAITSRVYSEWLVMQWHGRPRRSLTTLTPIGWLINKLPTNLALFKDAGVRYVRKVLVLPSPGPHDALVVRTADHLASQWNAKVTLARFVYEDAEGLLAKSEADYLEQLTHLCAAPTDTVVLRAKNKVASITAAAAGYDLLVMAAPNLTLRNLVYISMEDRITASATCSVLTLRTSPEGIHEAFSRRRVDVSHERAQLRSYLTPELVGARIEVSRKDALLGFLAERFSDVFEGVDAKSIRAALQHREREQNTGVGRGVALPHGTVPEVPRPVVAVFTLAEPIEYDAIDGEPIDVVFATLCLPGERETQLQLLSDIARICSKTDVLAKLRAAETDAEALVAVRRAADTVADAGRLPKADRKGGL